VLYLDSSALVKRYRHESGTAALNKRLAAEADSSRPIFTSTLTYAEIHAAVARRTRDGQLSMIAATAIQEKFDSDWVLAFTPIELGPRVLGFIPSIVKQFPLKGADAVHLASALWLRDTARLSRGLGKYGDPVFFVSSDKSLGNTAARVDLEVFNPETQR
jgi:predicted nucleic acid-binding protein